jgi:hypothetical protein
MKFGGNLGIILTSSLYTECVFYYTISVGALADFKRRTSTTRFMYKRN